MPDVKIRTGVWNEITAAARKQGRKPEALANRALQEFLQRLADEELILRSEKAARRTPLPLNDTEKAIRKYRQRLNPQG